MNPFIFLLIAVACTSLFITGFANGQAQPITPKSAGSTSAILGIIISKNQFYNGNQSIAIYTPSKYRTDEMADDTSDLMLCLDNFQSANQYVFNNIWNFTTAESTTIKNFFRTLPRVRSNNHLTFSAKWQADGRFEVKPETWEFTYPSLLPWVHNVNCNLTAIREHYVEATKSLPTACKGVDVYSFRAKNFPECLFIQAYNNAVIRTICNNEQRALLTNFYCTDGEAGVKVMCDTVDPWLPSGDPSAPTVDVVGPEGIPASGRQDQVPAPPASAGKIENVFLVMLLINFVFFSVFIL